MHSAQPGVTGPAAGGRAGTVAAASLALAAVFSSRLAVANPLLVIAAIAAWRAWRSGQLASRPWARSLVPPLIALALFSIISAIASLDPLISLGQLPRLLIFFVVPLAAALIDLTWWRRLVAGVAAATTVLAIWGLVQYAHGANNLSDRITGPLSHYMTYAGWLTLAVLVMVAVFAFETGALRWLLLIPIALGSTAILLSYTRNAWVGVGVGVLILAVIWRRRVLLLYPILAVLIWLIAPHAVIERVVSIVDLRQPANYDRLCMVVSGTEMIRDHPWSGVGLDMVSRVYPLYRRDDAPRWRVPHLHNNLLQIAAERGLPALGAYLWLLGAFFTRVWKALPDLADGPRAAASAALIGLAGITVAGLFEYNFWDAEIQYLTLVLLGVGVGMAARGERAA